jgi:hypothetical protein
MQYLRRNPSLAEIKTAWWLIFSLNYCGCPYNMFIWISLNHFRKDNWLTYVNLFLQLVQILKSCDYRTLAIGDGGNDMRMIQQADIGVGIMGEKDCRQLIIVLEVSISFFFTVCKSCLSHVMFALRILLI